MAERSSALDSSSGVVRICARYKSSVLLTPKHACMHLIITLFDLITNIEPFHIFNGRF